MSGTMDLAVNQIVTTALCTLQQERQDTQNNYKCKGCKREALVIVGFVEVGTWIGKQCLH